MQSLGSLSVTLSSGHGIMLGHLVICGNWKQLPVERRCRLTYCLRPRRAQILFALREHPHRNYESPVSLKQDGRY